MILEEFDYDKRAVIEPHMIYVPVRGFPEVAVSCFSCHLFESVLSVLEHKKIASIKDAGGRTPVYEVVYKGEKFAFYMSSVGAPSCVGDFEDAHAMGARALVLFGNCGVLDKSIEDCGIIIPTAAIRDEGTSYHYAPPSDTIEVNKKYREDFKAILKERGMPYTEGMIWTTDAFYRETKGKIAKRRAMGAVCVEMECASMQAVCDFRGADFFEFFYAGDNLDHTEWEPRSLSGTARLDEKTQIALLAFELALIIKGQKTGETEK